MTGECARCGTESDDLWCRVCPSCRPSVRERLERRKLARRPCAACRSHHFVAGPLPWCVSSATSEAPKGAEKYLARGGAE